MATMDYEQENGRYDGAYSSSAYRAFQQLLTTLSHNRVHVTNVKRR